jgi:hypothetical protein
MRSFENLELPLPSWDRLISGLGGFVGCGLYSLRVAESSFLVVDLFFGLVEKIYPFDHCTHYLGVHVWAEGIYLFCRYSVYLRGFFEGIYPFGYFAFRRVAL